MELYRDENTEAETEIQQSEQPKIKELRLLYQEYSERAHRFIEKEDYEQAIENVAQSVDLTEQLVQITDDEQDRERLFSDCKTLARLYKVTENTVQAERYFMKAISTTLSHEEQADRNGIIECLCDLSEICIEENNFDNAELLLRGALCLYEQLCGENTEQRTAFSSVFESLDNIEKAVNNLMKENEIVERLDQAVARQNMVIGTMDLKFSASEIFFGFFRLYMRKGNPGKAIEYSKIEKEEKDRLHIEETDAVISDGLAVLNCYLACLVNNSESDGYYKEAYEIWSELAGKNPAEPRYAKCRDLVKKHIGN